MDFGDAREGADILRVGLNCGPEPLDVEVEHLEALSQSFMAFGEAIEAFVGGHRYFLV